MKASNRSANSPRRNAAPTVKHVVAGVLVKNGDILICQEEELGIDAQVGEEVARIRHRYKTGNSVELRFYLVRRYRGEIENRIFREVRWSPRAELPTYDFLEADLPLVKDLAEGKIT